MKRVLSYIAIAAVATACSEMYGPEQESTAVVNSEGIEITNISVTDNSITFTLAPKGETAYYSYLVDQADTPQVLDSSAVYQLSYDGTVAEGTVKWTSDKNSSTITVEDLDPNTTYQIYAVAGSTTGVPGSVVSASAKTTDGVNPSPATFSAEDNVVTLTFSEGVTRGEGAVTVAYYATNTQAFYTDPQPVGFFTAAAEDIASDGSSAVTITVNGAPAGALYTVSLAAGAFKDSKGNPTPELTSNVTMTEEGPAPDGIYGQLPAATFEIAPVEAEAFTDPALPIQTDIDSEYELAGYGEGNGSVVFRNSVKTTEIVLTAGTDFGLLQDGSLAVFLPEIPELGDDVILTIEEGAFLDIYGNGNAEWTATLKYSYGYTMEDVYGVYTYSCINGLTGEQDSGQIVITESDEPEYGNVMFTSFMGYDGTSLYGTFNTDAGTLSVETLQGFTVEGDIMIGFGTLILSGGSVSLDGENPTVFNMPEAGRIVFNNGYFGVFSATLQGQIENLTGAYTMFEAVKQNTSLTEYIPKAPATASKVVPGNFMGNISVR